MMENKEYWGLTPERLTVTRVAATWISDELKQLDPTKSGVLEVTPGFIARKVAEGVVKFDLTAEEGFMIAYTMGLFSKRQ